MLRAFTIATVAAIASHAERCFAVEAGRFELTIGPGWVDGRDFPDRVSEAMHPGQLDQPHYNSPPYQEYPTEQSTRTAGTLTITGWVNPWFGVRLDGAIESLGSVTGHSATFFDHFLRVHGSIGALAALATARYGPLRVGIGPAVDLVATTAERSSVGATEPGYTTSSRDVNAGWAADVALDVPASGPAFAHLGWQRRWMGAIDIGPYDLANYSDPAFMPQTRVSLDRSRTTLALGIRIPR
jgi:hypothetical protein